jgi:hypothetical protein
VEDGETDILNQRGGRGQGEEKEELYIHTRQWMRSTLALCTGDFFTRRFHYAALLSGATPVAFISYCMVTEKPLTGAACQPTEYSRPPPSLTKLIRKPGPNVAPAPPHSDLPILFQFAHLGSTTACQTRKHPRIPTRGAHPRHTAHKLPPRRIIPAQNRVPILQRTQEVVAQHVELGAVFFYSLLQLCGVEGGGGGIPAYRFARDGGNGDHTHILQSPDPRPIFPPARTSASTDAT